MILLEPITQYDLLDMFNCRNDERIMKWCRQSEPITWRQHINWWRSLVATKNDMKKIRTLQEQFVGVCGLTNIVDKPHLHAEFSLYIDPKHHRKGYGRMALIELLKHGFSNANSIGIPFEVIWGETFEGNPALAMFEQIGMRIEGIRKRFYRKDDKWLDCTIVAITKPEFEERVNNGLL